MTEREAPARRIQPRIAAVVGEAHVSHAPARRWAHARDAWPRLFLLAREGRYPRPPDLVVWPGHLEEVAVVVRLAAEAGVPIVPYGAGSGVCGGTLALHGGIALDLSRLDHVGDVQPMDRLVTVGAGAVGAHLEARLERQGFTLGHFPASIRTSTVGGWIAARGAGQMSSRYGKIEDLVSGLTWVDGTGRIRRIEARPHVLEPDAAQLVTGSEGVLGVVVDATLRVRRRPAVRQLRGVLLPSVEAGIEAMRRIFAEGLRPAVVRLYDPLDSLVNKGRREPGEPEADGGWARRLAGALAENLPLGTLRAAATRRGLEHPRLLNLAVDRLGRSALLILGSEGTDERWVSHDSRRALALAVAAGGRDLGPGPGEAWLAHRYSVSFKMTPMLDLGGFVDTMEVATTWDRLPRLYHGVRRALRDRAFVMAHFSHAYEDGCSIYFTFAGAAADAEERARRYDRAWIAALDAVHAAGATTSHHHGIGLAKQGWLPRELGEGMALLRAVKAAADPNGIMNPGKLALDGPPLPQAGWKVPEGAWP